MLAGFGLVETKAKAVSVGDRFGRLLVVAVGQVPGTYRYKAICQCDCGSPLKAIRMDDLLRGQNEGCGCIRLERSTTHGLSKSPHYFRWRNMLDRCDNPRCAAYPNYGGRGIKVCDEWRDLATFITDLPDGYFPGAEIDRIDNDGDYRPGNVRWSSPAENADNRRSGRLITFSGKTLSLQGWSKETGIHIATLWERFEVWGWLAERALTTPPIGAAERMARARSARWGSHVKKPKRPPRVLSTYDFNGEMLTIREIADRTGIEARLLRKRICERGWSVARATAKRGTPMMPSIPTVKVKRDGPRGWRIINEPDFDPAVHELWDEADAISEGLANPIPMPDLGELPEDQRAALEALAGDDFTDWQSWHWKTKVKRAKELTGRDEVSPDEANEIIAAEVAKRGAQDEQDA